jgi:hypothetical protein
MIRIFLILALISPSLLVAQKELTLDKKYVGSYSGIIPSFQLKSGDETIQVDSTTILITLDASRNVEIVVGKQKSTGIFKIILETKAYYLLDCTMADQLMTERIVVYKRKKEISRDGMNPQPNVTLYKMKKTKGAEGG